MPPPPGKPTGPPSDRHPRSPPKDPYDEEAPSLNLWVGNLSQDTVDSDLMAVFAKHGALDVVTAYTPRAYAFVYFKHLEDAEAAMDALQGTVIHGKSIKIKFARLAKPGKHLWIGGISSSITKEQLEDEFLKFGKIEECKFLRDRNSAFIDYYKIEDAMDAQKNMNDKHLAGEQIRVDFQRSQSSRRYDSRDGRFSHKRNMGPLNPWMPPDGMRNFQESSNNGPKRHPPSGGRREGHPSNILWIGYPPSVHVDEPMLHNVMMLFGEIKRITSFPSRYYSFVEFRSIDEACCAKEALEGRLFNDPRIQILFSSSELTLNKDNPRLFPGFRGPRPEMLNETFIPMELFVSGSPVAPNNFPGQGLPNDMPGPNMLRRPFEAQGFDPHHGGLEFHDFSGLNNTMAPTQRWLSSPPPGMLPSAPGMRPPFRPMPVECGGFDLREPKRPRTDGCSPNDAPFHARRVNSEDTEDFFVLPPPDRVVSDQTYYSPVVRNPGELRGSSDNDHCWRGVIAKGGSPVCHARCVPIGKGIDSPFPDIINCSARTGLDMLTKHYAEAVGFDIVFFLPNSEEDFASYTEFLRYLGLKNRAGVAKFDDGTTLFLVPPSDFLTKVLTVSGPERLYGVVLKLPQQSTSAKMQQPQEIAPPLPRYIDRQPGTSSLRDYSLAYPNGDQASKMDYGWAMHEHSVPDAGAERPLITHAGEPHAMQSAPLDYVSKTEATSKVEISLTPELLATLASLIPTNIQSSTNGSIQLPSISSFRPASFSTSAMDDRSMLSQGHSQEHQAPVMNGSSMPSQGWTQEHPVTFSGTPQKQTSNLPQQVGHQIGDQIPLIGQFPTYTSMPSVPDHFVQPVLGDTQFQDPSLDMPQVSEIPYRPSNNYVIPYHNGQFSTFQTNQQYQLDSSVSSQKYHGMLQTTHTAGGFKSPVQQQLNPTNAHGQIGNVPQPQITMPVATDKLDNEFYSQVQQLQSAPSGSDQGPSEGNADKIQQYQSTLQYAASLLRRLQQPQQVSAQPVQGSGNEQ